MLRDVVDVQYLGQLLHGAAGLRVLEEQLPQRVRIMGPLDLVTDGEVKVLLDDALPALDGVVALVRDAHGIGRGVALHCVTLVQLLFAIETGLRLGEHRTGASRPPTRSPPCGVSD